MKDACEFDGVPCPKEPMFYYVWEWGDDGVCCADHRGVLLTRAGQLSRTITFSSLGREAKRDYAPPKLQPLAADDGKVLKAKLSEELEQRKALERQIAKLESEREASKETMREQELRIQDLLKQNAEVKAALATAELEHAAALELATAPAEREVIEGADEATPATHGAKGSKRSR